MESIREQRHKFGHKNLEIISIIWTRLASLASIESTQILTGIRFNSTTLAQIELLSLLVYIKVYHQVREEAESGSHKSLDLCVIVGAARI